jgi:ATPase subunit of ABC transporter with duplicated ATPase domains
LGLIKTKKILLPKWFLKTTIMNIINGLTNQTGQVILRKSIRMAFLSQDNNLQDELTIEESIFALTTKR